MDAGYFDITHSFKIDSSTYHVLGLRKDRPTYGNNYYIFHCGCGRPHSARYASVSLPRLSSRDRHVFDETLTCHEHERNFQQSRTGPRSGSSKKTNPTMNIEEIRQTLTNLMKSEHENLAASLRKDIHDERRTILRSIEKETQVFNEATSSTKGDKEELLRLLERQRASLESLVDRDTKEILAAIDLLKKTFSQTARSQNEQFASLNQFQVTLKETLEQQIEQAMNKQLGTQRPTSLDAHAVQQIQTTIVDTLNKRSSASKDDEDTEALKRLLNDHQQHINDLLMKQQRGYTTSTEEIKKMQTKILETIEHPNRTDGNDHKSIQVLLDEQTRQITDVIVKQQQKCLSVDLLRETMSSVLHEQSTGMNRVSPMKLSVKSNEFAHVFARLYIDGNEYPKETHTMCQRDPDEPNVVDCFIAPPIVHGLCELILYAKTPDDDEYRATLCAQISKLDVPPANVFPQLFDSFHEKQCILIEPLRRFLRKDQTILLQMIIPHARQVKIRNGDKELTVNRDEYRDGLLKKNIEVQGNLLVVATWNSRDDQNICAFQIE